jgi:hypothetical protein
MPRRPSAFRQSDVERAIRAAQAAGIIVTRIEVTHDGKIVLYGDPGGASIPSKPDEPNEWDAVGHEPKTAA